VMFTAGLVAYACSQAMKLLLPNGNIWSLLLTSGLTASVIALAAFAIGRGASFASLQDADEPRLLGWLGAWIGFVYGIQLSLMVLALLKVVVRYDFLLHPDGPAMMAIIIACTSVARDAFEIGHIRRLQKSAKPIVTFPDGSALRAMLATGSFRIIGPVVGAAAITVLVALSAAEASVVAASDLGQLIIVSLVSATLGLGMYLSSKEPDRPWLQTLRGSGGAELLRFWWWPGLAFGATYYLSLQGVVLFMAGADLQSRGLQSLLAGSVGAGMALYCYYLGQRRAIEDGLNRNVPSSLLRCPFVLSILSKGKAATSETPVSESMILREERH